MLKKISCLLGCHNYRLKDMTFDRVTIDYDKGVGYYIASLKCAHCGKVKSHIVEIPTVVYEGEKNEDLD